MFNEHTTPDYIIEKDIDTPHPKPPTSLRVRAALSAGFAGVVVILLGQGGNPVAYITGFSGTWAVFEVTNMIFKIAKSYGAIHYEWKHLRPDKKNHDVRM